MRNLARKGTADPAATAALERARKQAEEDGVVVSNGRRTIGSQTVYRESEAQTDPYTPEYVLTVAEPSPEILALAHMKAGTGSLLSVRALRSRRSQHRTRPCLA